MAIYRRIWPLRQAELYMWACKKHATGKCHPVFTGLERMEIVVAFLCCRSSGIDVLKCTADRRTESSCYLWNDTDTALAK